MKQKELLTRQRDLAVKLQHHFTVSQMRFENLQQELEQTTAQEESLLQMELLGRNTMFQASKPPLSPIPSSQGVHGVCFLP
ncbi:disks large homolog 5-like [Peromyscus leucopus]|uniref:disks large homolog 5-like n=1 Tax=Peromyscus leucopus TaxID=10041 RepID=UPI0018855DE4|nr:disks large homolog 5-like [Peromyscus leucopus]